MFKRQLWIVLGLTLLIAVSIQVGEDCEHDPVSCYGNGPNVPSDPDPGAPESPPEDPGQAPPDDAGQMQTDDPAEDATNSTDYLTDNAASIKHHLTPWLCVAFLNTILLILLQLII